MSLPRDAPSARFLDLTVCTAGDLCPKCGAALNLARGIEVGHVFKLGTKYTESFGASFLDASGQTQTPVMGCYGIGVTRTLQAVVEQNFDGQGICWPVSVAPCEVAILALDPASPDCMQQVDRLERELTEAGIDVLVDDRAERPGVKFNDADLIGFPFRVVVGAKSLAKGGVEVKSRDNAMNEIIAVADAPGRLIEIVRKCST